LISPEKVAALNARLPELIREREASTSAKERASLDQRIDLARKLLLWAEPLDGLQAEQVEPQQVSNPQPPC
jgi:hypothetical protein